MASSAQLSSSAALPSSPWNGRTSSTLHTSRNHGFSSSPSPSSTITITIPNPCHQHQHHSHRHHLRLHLHSINTRNHGLKLRDTVLQHVPSFTCASAQLGSEPTTSLQEEGEGEENDEKIRGLYDPDQEEDVANCQEILRVLEVLKEKRDMPFNEVRLTIMIEDPREEERREEFNVENERGCSREDMAAALVDVYEGRIPSDRLVLRELTKEMLSWPNLEDELDDSQRDATMSPYAKTTDTGVDPRIKAQRLKVDWDKAAEIEPGKESDDPNVPPVVGFSVLYLVSAIPIIIGIAVVAILYSNSFR